MSVYIETCQENEVYFNEDRENAKTHTSYSFKALAAKKAAPADLIEGSKKRKGK
ncbi:hypothetical protein KDK_27910 [Dictyobacter kobayashii]|uniref:Uncharacterized protein n=1 Tax=Dictyobacter kobayashii TaxID=2014872 RepID=A0A402AIN3_9CHLR|nr:hypothetical protein KDK_27910 [Dictyobacter kobayashii]